MPLEWYDFKEALIYSSFRRRPESMLLKSLDPGIRRDDGKVINQRFLNFAIFASLRELFFLDGP